MRTTSFLDEWITSVQFHYQVHRSFPSSLIPILGRYISFYELCLQLLMANLYRNSTDARAISKRFNMQRYGDNRRTEEPTFSVIESMTYCFSMFFLRKLNFFAVPESRQIESHYKKFATGDFDFLIGFGILISCLT